MYVRIFLTNQLPVTYRVHQKRIFLYKLTRCLRTHIFTEQKQTRYANITYASNHTKSFTWTCAHTGLVRFQHTTLERLLIASLRGQDFLCSLVLQETRSHRCSAIMTEGNFSFKLPPPLFFSHLFWRITKTSSSSLHAVTTVLECMLASALLQQLKYSYWPCPIEFSD